MSIDRGRTATHEPFLIRQVYEEELAELGQLMVSVYSNLEGFPDQDQQPAYYEMLANIGRLTRNPDTKLLVAVTEDDVAGGVVYFSDMARYGSGGLATHEKDASGFRLLAVAPNARGMGVGKALAEKCIELAKEKNHRRVIIHTTRAMKVAWGMYERLGFERAPELDFMQQALPVFGFRLKLSRQTVRS
jgi:GNAT superfamily N-acetyltransferase